MSILTAIGSLITGPVETILETRKQRRIIKAQMAADVEKAKAERAIAKLKSEATIAEKRAQAEVDWENIWAEQAAKSWKDEYWTIYLSIPVGMAFIPGLQEHALKGFDVIAQMPDWYMAALTGAIGAAFGLRALTKFTRKDK